MAAHRRRLHRTLAAILTIGALLAVTPTTVYAEGQPFWSTWVKRSWKRESKAEIPFAVLFSLPPMLICTPFWLGNLAVGAMKSRGDDDDDS